MNGEVDEVPIIRLLSIQQIKRENFVAGADGLLVILQSFGGQLFEFRYKNQQATQAHLVPTVLQQFWYFAQRKVLWDSTYNLACLWYLQAEELITLTILTWSRFEEPHEYLSLLVILQRLHISYDFFRSLHTRLSANCCSKASSPDFMRERMVTIGSTISQSFMPSIIARITFPAEGAQLPFSMIPNLRFW